VLWAPPNFGKSSTVRRVALKLQEEKRITGVLSIACNESWKEHESLQKWLYSHFPLPEQEYPRPLGEFIDRPQRVLLLIDQFDKLMAHPRCELFVTSLAEASVMRKVYTILVLVTSEAHYKEI